MIQRLWGRVGLIPRFGIIIVLALIGTQVLKEGVMLRLASPPKIAFFTRDWLAERTLEAVRIATAAAPDRRAQALGALDSKWLAFSPLSGEVQADASPPPAVESLRKVLEEKLGSSVRRVCVSAMRPHDPSRAASGVSFVIAEMPALADIVHDNLEEGVMIVGQLQIGLQLTDGTWIAVTESGREYSTAYRIRNLLTLVAGLSLIAGLSLLAARMIMRPLQRLAEAADRLGREREFTPVHKTGLPELDAIADSFNQMQQRLKRFIDERTHMLAAISHDLRTPLTRMRLFAEVVGDKQQWEPMLNDIGEMEQMLRASLVFAGNEARREPHSRVDIAALLISLCDTISDAGGRVSYEGPNHAELPCQPVAIRRAFSNLIDNACKYGEQACVRLIDGAGMMEVTIGDCGPGIPAEQVELAFTPFRRLEGSRNRESGGTGLGLSIARDIVHGHGGSIELEANQPQGLLVRVRLPKPHAALAGRRQVSS
ncbi:MAG: ATP-binding protein [Steroidobacteraceae bacterium]